MKGFQIEFSSLKAYSYERFHLKFRLWRSSLIRSRWSWPILVGQIFHGALKIISLSEMKNKNCSIEVMFTVSVKSLIYIFLDS